jgi:hypothetical protein
MTLRKTSAASFEWRAASALLFLATAPFLCADAGTRHRHSPNAAASANTTHLFDIVIIPPL